MNNDESTGEYTAINFDGLERRANYRTIAYREDMLHVFGRRDAAAIIYHIIYRWQTDYKRADILKEIERRKAAKLPALTPAEVEDRMWVYMSYNDFVRESGSAVAYNTVIRTLKYLVDDIKIIEQRDNHNPHYPDYEYRINKEVAKKLLTDLPAEPAFTPKIPKKKEKSTQMGTGALPPTSTQMGTADTENQSTHLGTGYTQNGIASTHLGTEVYPNGGTSQITTQDSTEDNTEESESEHEQEETTPIASALCELDAAPDRDNDNQSQLSLTESTTPEGDTDHAIPVPLLCPPSLFDHHDLPAAPGAVQVVRVGVTGHSDGVPVVAPVVFAAGSPRARPRARQDTGIEPGAAGDGQSVDAALPVGPTDGTGAGPTAVHAFGVADSDATGSAAPALSPASRPLLEAHLTRSVDSAAGQGDMAARETSEAQAQATVALQQDHGRRASHLSTSGSPPVAITEGRAPMIVVGSLTVTPIAEGGATVPVEVSHPEDRGACVGSATVEVRDPGQPPPPGAPSPQMHVLIVKQQFTSVDEWKAAQETFTRTLSSVWKGSNAADKKRYGTWSGYRKQHLARWLDVNPDPSIVRFTPEGRVLFDEWCSLFKVKVDAGKATIEAANWLAEPCTTWAGLLGMSRPEVLRDFKGWCYTNDKNGYYTRGVKLYDLRKEFEGWQSYQQSLLDKAEREKARPQNKHGTASGLPRLEIDQEWLKAMGGRA